MKKSIIIVMMAFLFLLLTSCNQGSVLTTPQGFTISDDVITFQTVEQAERYRIEVEDVSTNQIRRFFVENGQNVSTLFLSPGTYAIKIQAIGDQQKITDSAYSDSIIYVQIDPYAVREISADFLMDEARVKWLGRHYYDSSGERVFFFFTASGFEVTFYGTELEADFFATNMHVSGKQPHLVVLTSLDMDPSEGELIVLTSMNQTVKLIEGLEEGIHTIRVLKRSESIDSGTALTSIRTDGYFVETPPIRDRKIEVIAASSSAGFGNLALSSQEAKTTQNSDGLRAYAYLTARMLDAEINVFSASGWPLLRGPWTGLNNIPGVYDYVDVYSSNVWRHIDYQPDVIVINLGTNDWSYINSLAPHERDSAIENFIQSYVVFIANLHTIHPQASIAVIYGLMAEVNIFEATEDVVERVQATLPNVSIVSIQLPGVNLTDGIGSSNHPSLTTHIKAADVLANALKDFMGWDIVNDNITE